MAFDFGAAAEIVYVRKQLAAAFGRLDVVRTRGPIGQLVKSMISNRTRDEDSLRAYERLIAAFPAWADMAAVEAGALEALIPDVKFADVKARHLVKTLRAIATSHPDFDLNFLSSRTVGQALA